jgi:hypothetical protein
MAPGTTALCDSCRLHGQWQLEHTCMAPGTTALCGSCPATVTNHCMRRSTLSASAFPFHPLTNAISLEREQSLSSSLSQFLMRATAHSRLLLVAFYPHRSSVFYVLDSLLHRVEQSELLEFWTSSKQRTNSVAPSPQANYTD